MGIPFLDAFGAAANLIDNVVDKVWPNPADKAKAEASFKASLKVDGKAGAVHFSLGELYENDKKTELALKEYETASGLGFAEATDAVKRLKGGK